MKLAKIYIGNDHAGVSMKKKLIAYLESKGHSYEDLGSVNPKAADDYVDFAKKVGKAVAKSQKTRGILLCGTGTGMVMAANKVKGVRASLCHDTYTAKMARHDNNANVLCLQSRRMSFVKQIPIIRTWLQTPFSNLARHKRRLKKLEAK